MSHHLNSKKQVLLFGPGEMGVEYFKVLKSLGVGICSVVGKSDLSIQKFYTQTGFDSTIHKFSSWKRGVNLKIQYAIVAVSIEELFKVVMDVMDFGIKRILVEKPGALTIKQIRTMRQRARQTRTKIYVAYNRRFYSSVLSAQKIIKKDGGVKSFHFEFTEWSHLVQNEVKNKDVKNKWFMSNSSHVVDLAFYLGGLPRRMHCHVAGSLDWHKSAAIFAGAGRTKSGALFSYHANWDAPGRWGVEIQTKNYRLIFRPLEELKLQRKASVEIEAVDIDDALDKEYKPGLFLQTRAFLNGEAVNLKTLEEQVNDFEIYYQMANYKI